MKGEGEGSVKRKPANRVQQAFESINAEITRATAGKDKLDLAKIRKAAQSIPFINERDLDTLQPLALKVASIDSPYAPQVLEVLIKEFGALPTAKDKRGNGMLHVAYGTRNIPVILYLKDRPEKLDWPNHKGMRPEDIVSKDNDAEFVDMVQQAEIIEIGKRAVNVHNLIDPFRH